jgi:hypothetical protein
MMIRMLLGEVCIHKISLTYLVIGSLRKHIHKSLILSSTTSYIK